MKINEIFYSIQGEGANVGIPMVFVRLSGCNLSCIYCDTEFESGSEMTTDQILKEIENYPCQWILWTGGEPMQQLTAEIVEKFSAAGYKQAIETNGSRPIPFELDWVTVSPKVAEHVLASNFPQGVDELRYPWHAQKRSLPSPKVSATHLFLSPINDGDALNRENLAACISTVKACPQFRLSCQMQKTWVIR